jgi:DNA-binding CsgD family transcriptional regulator
MAGRDDGDWLEFVAELMREPLTELPIGLIAARVKESFDACAVAENAPNWSGVFRDELWPLDAGLDGYRGDMRDWRASPSVATHPVLYCYLRTGDVRTVQIAELDEAFVRPWRVDGGERLARDCGANEQLCIPVGGGGPHPRTLVAGRTTPFTEEEIHLATLLGELFTGLDRQVRAHRQARDRMTPSGQGVASAVRLTHRETTVLDLLSQGLTAGAIARRLGIAERTVHKHLERCYGKLGVADRLSAVLQAQRLGLVAA